MAKVQDIGVRVVIMGMGEFRRNVGAVQSDMKNLETTARGLSGSTLALGQNLTKLGNAISGVGRTLSLTLTAPLAATLGALISQGIEFEDAFAGVGKTVDDVTVGFREVMSTDPFWVATISDYAKQLNALGSAGQKFTWDEALEAYLSWMPQAQKDMVLTNERFGQLTDQGLELRNAFRAMALEIPITASELARVGQVAGQLGVQADQLEDFVEIMALLGVTTDLSAEDAAFAVARFGNIFGVEADAMAEFAGNMGDAIVALGNNAAATEPEIVSMALRIASTGRMVGLTEQEVLGMAATLIEMGVASERGGTAVSRILQEMMYSIADGGEQLEMFAEIAGTTTDEFATLFKTDAVGAMDLFLTNLAELQESGQITSDTLLALGLSGIRVKDVMQILGPNMGLMRDNIDLANTAWDQNIALNEEAAKRFKTIKSQIQLVKNAFTDLGITLVDLYEEDIRNIVTKIGELIDKFRELTPEQQKNIVKWILIAIAIGPVLVMIGTLISAIGSIISVMGALSIATFAVSKFALGGMITVVHGLATALGVANAALYGFLTPALLVAAALTAMYLADFGSFKDQVDDVRKAIEEFIDNPSVSGFVQILEEIGEALLAIPESIAGAFGIDLEELLSGWKDSITDAIWGPIEDLFSTENLQEKTQDFIGRFGFSFITADYETFKVAVGALPGQLWEGIKTGLGDIWQWVQDNIITPIANSFLGDALTGIFDAGKTMAKNLTDGLIEGIKNNWEAFKDYFEQLLRDLPGGGLVLDAINTIASIGRASGGDLLEGQVSVVGERGPELFMPTTDGTIVPNHQLPQMFGGQLPNLAGTTISNTNVYAPNFYGTPNAETMDANREMLQDWSQVTQAMGAG